MSKVAVIGGGPMGLAVAYYLLKSGKTVEVFEADSVLGGMSAQFDFDGTLIERYYHFICGSDKPLFDLLDELGLQDKLCWTATKMGFYYQGTLYPWGDPVALLTFPKLDLISKLRYGVMAFISTKRSDWSGLDKLDAVTWIKRWIGPKAYDVLWKSLFELKFYHYTPNLSAAWIWTRIKRVGASRKNLMEERMGYMEGGSQVVIDALEAAILDMGGVIHRSTPISQVVLENDRVTGLLIGEEQHNFEQVVSTTPIPYITRLIPQLPDPIKQKFEALENIAVVCLIIKLRKSVTQNFWLNINDESMDIPGMVEYTNLNALGDHIVYVPYYMPGEHPMFQDPDEKFIEKVKGYMMTINPDIQASDFMSVVVSRYRFAQPICTPRFMESLPPIDLPVQGLYAADTSYYYPEDRSICESIKLGKQVAQLLIDE